MKNLSDFGVKELSTKEIKETNGGGWLVFLLVGWMVLALISSTVKKSTTISINGTPIT